MEDFKDKILFTLLLIFGIMICVASYYFLCVQELVYYTQVDNSRIERVDSNDNMKYEYTLVCFNDKGKEKEIKFKTSRELRDDAFLKLEVISFSGVHSWEEVLYNELPEKVQAVYSKNEF